MAGKKTAEPKIPSCTLQQLLNVGPIQIVAKVGNQEVQLGYAEPRSFSTGSYGFNLNGKTNIPVQGGIARLQMSCNLTVVNSKEAPAE